MSACTICATFCSSVSRRSRSEMRASIRGSRGTALVTDGQTTSCDANGRFEIAGPVAQHAATTPPQIVIRTATRQRLVADRMGWLTSTVTSRQLPRRVASGGVAESGWPRYGGTLHALETDLHAHSVGSRRVEDDLLGARVNGRLRGVGLVRQIVDEAFDAHVALFVRVADAEVQVRVSVNLVIQPQQVGSICGGHAPRIHRGHGLRTVATRSPIEGAEELP